VAAVVEHRQSPLRELSGKPFGAGQRHQCVARAVKESHRLADRVERRAKVGFRERPEAVGEGVGAAPVVARERISVSPGDRTAARVADRLQRDEAPQRWR
jgi:hypothetical protein